MKINLSICSRARRWVAAFSLVEATIGMGVIGTLVGALMSGFTSGLFSMQLARENLRATQIMLERMETIRLYSWSQITATNPVFITPDFTAQYDPNSPNAGVTYTGKILISDVPVGFSSSYGNEMKLVTVQLNWKTGNLSRSREFNSYISRSGMQNYVY